MGGQKKLFSYQISLSIYFAVNTVDRSSVWKMTFEIFGHSAHTESFTRPTRPICRTLWNHPTLFEFARKLLNLEWKKRAHNLSILRRRPGEALNTTDCRSPEPSKAIQTPEMCDLHQRNHEISHSSDHNASI